MGERKQAMAAAQRDAAIKLRKEGLTWTEIASRLGITKKAAIAKGRAAIAAKEGE